MGSLDGRLRKEWEGAYVAKSFSLSLPWSGRRVDRRPTVCPGIRSRALCRRPSEDDAGGRRLSRGCYVPSESLSHFQMV